MTDHQLKQIAVINAIEKQVADNAIGFTTVPPVEDYVRDRRICLTSVHFPDAHLIEKINRDITPLKTIEPRYYYYQDDALHMTIKNIRVINNPPHFTEDDKIRAEKLLSEIVPHHKQFNVYFYRLLLFQNNLALVGTTDPELDLLHNNLDNGLKEMNLADDKVYSNTKYFFCNMTLARFDEASEAFRYAVSTISNELSFEPYIIDSVSLVTSNAVFYNPQIINTWKLKKDLG
jgi:2'-5' RNA ligase